MSKEVFGEELWSQIETTVKEKGLNLIVDNKEKPEYIPKDRFNEVIGSKNELKAQVSELSAQLETLKKASKGNDELTKTIEELQKKNGEWEGKYKNTLLESAIKIKAMSEKAKDAGDLIKFLDTSKLEIDETGNVKGLDEQLKTLKESKSYLFDVAQQNNNTGANPAAGSGNTNPTTKEQYNALLTEISKNPGDASLMQKLFLLKEKMRT